MLKLTWLSITLILFEYAIAWSNFADVGGVLNHVAVCSWGPGRIDVFGAASNGEIWHRVCVNGGWGDWGNMGGNTQFKPSAFSIKTNWLDLVYTGPDQMLYRKTWNGNNWADTKNTNGGVFIAGPSITASVFDTSNLHVFAVTTNKNLLHSSVDTRNNKWSTWENLGGSCYGEPAAVSWGANRFDIFAVFGDSKIWQKTWDGAAWQEWKMLSGTYKPGLGAASRGPGMISVFGVGMNDGIYTRLFVSGQWNDVEFVGGKVKSSPAAVATTSTRVDVFGIGFSDGHVWQSYFEAKNDGNPTNYGCYRGYCWGRCSTTFIDAIANNEWC